jgi:hypothetical protein
MNTTSHTPLARISIGLVSIVVLCLFNGCANYQLGSSATPPFKSIYIKPATNYSFAPQAQAIVSAQIREAFIRDARVKLVTKQATADAVLFVDLTAYDRNAGARNDQDTVIADDFDIRLTADISLLDQAAGEYLFQERSVQARAHAYTGNPYAESDISSYQQGERQAIAQLARDIARQITDEVLSPW